ncbi:MAG TPA: EscU/YscU/HrcU family type III secretion system export apparatus switch protein [Bryobacteraceae bacterium]
MADKGQATEQPTQRRLDKARKDGRFPVSREMVGAAQFFAFAMLLASAGAAWCGGLKNLLRSMLAQAFTTELTPGALQAMLYTALFKHLAPLAALGLVLLAITISVQMAITRFGLATKNLAPQFSRLNFFSRLREIPRQNLPMLMQALVLLPVFGMAVYGVVKENLDPLTAMPLQGVERGAEQMNASLQTLIWRASGVFLVLGAVDFVRQKRRYTNDLKMSKQDIRDEYKELEGNPQIKSRIRRLQRDLMRRRMMSQVPTATAVIVNPTHYAVAIRYVMETMAAPVVVAKGKNHVALRIRQKAVEHQIPVIENPPLAQALYQHSEIGQEIPGHLFRAVAEILAYIYRLMGNRLPA